MTKYFHNNYLHNRVLFTSVILEKFRNYFHSITFMHLSYNNYNKTLIKSCNFNYL